MFLQNNFDSKACFFKSITIRRGCTQNPSGVTRLSRSWLIKFIHNPFKQICRTFIFYHGAIASTPHRKKPSICHLHLMLLETKSMSSPWWKTSLKWKISDLHSSALLNKISFFYCLENEFFNKIVDILSMLGMCGNDPLFII
jgi:hypothetical protein